jgi:TPR repeat protein
MASEGSASSLHRVPSAMPGGGARRKAVANPTGRERTPITKAAIDEYRNRIKADPDPESQFNFAKYLIEAARKLAQSTAHAEDTSSSRNVKKYRDALLQESIKLIKRLATQGTGLGKPAYADAQFFLADCLSSGSLGLQVDHEKAYNLYVQASKQNHAPATYRTAVCNEGGHGTRKDPGRAVLFYRKASALGNTPGMYKLGMVLLNGLLGQPRNGKEAVTWLRRAAAQADVDNPHALHELGALYEKPPNPNAPNGPGPTVAQDNAQAFELYQQAAKLGYGLSQYKLGMAYEYGTLGCPVDPRCARRPLPLPSRADRRAQAIRCVLHGARASTPWCHHWLTTHSERRSATSPMPSWR